MVCPGSVPSVMDSHPVESWLRLRLREESNARILLGFGTLFSGGLLLLATFWISYAAIGLVFDVVLAVPDLLFGFRWRPSNSVLLWLTRAFTALLVWTSWRSKRPLTDLSEWDGDPSALGQTIARLGVGSAGGATPLLLYSGMSARLFTDLLLFGPGLIFSGWEHLREWFRLRTAETGPAAEVLVALRLSPGKTDYVDLEAQFPQSVLSDAFHLFRSVEGIVFLEQGLVLSGALRDELEGLER
jgi:hypothetical protein